MAKRKLSDVQRKSLRLDIAAGLSAGRSRTSLVKTLSSKFKISPISMRWYLRTQTSSGTVKPGASPSTAGTPTAKSITTRKRDPSLAAALGCGESGSPHNEESLVDILNGLTPLKLKRLIEAKKLVPKLTVHRRQELKLRGQIRLLEKKLEDELGKVRGFEAQIRRLAGL